MDDLVERALAKWPNVPSIAGWLALSDQGNWLLTQPGKSFADNELLRITNLRILRFIAANYHGDESGRFFFQNGPQKAFVTLEYTPWVFRIIPAGDALVLVSHTGLVALPSAIYSDEKGRILINSSLGVGILLRSDMELFSTTLDEGPDGAISHTARWWVPGNPKTDLPEQLIPLRSSGLSATTETLALPIESVLSSQVPKHFGFNPNPEVSQ